MLESELYPPVKQFLERLGYAVKGEIGGCDVLGVKEGAPPLLVICELKLSFNLELLLQAVDRATACDEVWIAARVSGHASGRDKDARYRNLCRRLGFGMLGIAAAGQVEIIVPAFAAAPRKSLGRRSVLLDEHRRRVGDPTRGGGSRRPIMTAYRQASLALAEVMLQGPQRPRDLRHLAPKAQAMLSRNVYGWFERVSRGRYRLTDTGRAAAATTEPS